MSETKNVFIIAIIISVLLSLNIYFLTPYLAKFESTLAPDSGASHYFWKLPLRDNLTQIIVWALYALHQIFVWATFYYAMKNKTKWSDKIKKINLLNHP